MRSWSRAALVGALAIWALGAGAVIDGASPHGHVGVTVSTHISGREGPVVAADGVVAEAPMPNSKGFWTVTPAGAVTTYGAAPYEGGMSGVALHEPVLGIASTPDGKGYWLVAADGGIFTFGDAHYYGSTGNIHLNQPIVGMASTPDGKGYWLVASDGGIFTFGDAHYYGSTGNIHLNQPIVGMASAPGGLGYWLVAADGGIFTFGDAHYYGSGSGRLGSAWAVGIVATEGGYWITTNAGTVLSFGAAPDLAGVAPNATPGGSPALVNISPSAAFGAACYVLSSATCNVVALAMIDLARATEGLPPMSLPGDFESLAPVSQLVMVANAERSVRGLPPFSGPVASLDARSTAAAQALGDPIGPAGADWASNWAYGYATPLAADFAWMYDDGLGSSNADCTVSNQSGCWGHRANILSPWSGSMGAADVVVSGSISLAELFVAG